MYGALIFPLEGESIHYSGLRNTSFRIQKEPEFRVLFHCQLPV